jgi:bifunctional UDP-N-acetylglucosamine pyrophosphorylase/glucosamine-1-phosphate N-acetyltransferase
MRIDDARERWASTTAWNWRSGRLLRERKRRELMLGGVTIEKPETVTIDADVRIGMDTVIEPFAQILGKTVIGEDCRIGACSIVRDSELATAWRSARSP